MRFGASPLPFDTALMPGGLTIVHCNKGVEMDVVCVVLVALFFAASAWLVRVCGAMTPTGRAK